MNPKAPSVSEDHINALHDSLSYDTTRMPNTTSTLATARLPGGFVVAVGHSACVSPANFNAEQGVKLAISDAAKNAKKALWEFEGYALARELNRAASSQVHPDSGLPSTPAAASNLFIGTKIVKAEPFTRAEYCAFRGWEVPADENGADDGYLVEYEPDGKPNVHGRAGYVTWSPKAPFDRAYKPYVKFVPQPDIELNTDRAQLDALGRK